MTSFTRFTHHLTCALLFTLTTALSQAAASPAAKTAESAQLAQDIASAGRLRMQAQRLAKLHQQVVSGINSQQAVQQIKQGINDVDSEITRLARYSKKPNVQRSYARNEALWLELRETLKKAAASPVSNERINQLADELMLHSGKLVMQIEAEADTPVGRLLDLSSRLNMLAQRLARLYLQAQAGDKTSGLLIDVEQARKEFTIGLHELDTAPENSPASREAITLAKNQWVFFDLAITQLKQAKPDDKAAHNVSTSSERIAQVLDAASNQYAKDYSESNRPR